jgi:predicted nucleotidyltransferase
MDHRIRKIIKGLQTYGAERAILFGSTARGDADNVIGPNFARDVQY